MTKTEKNIYDIALPIVNDLGYELYDVMYVKEGKEYYLRIFIDNEKGINLDDCEKVSNVLSDKLDEVDPITTSYNLEVSSCGLERHLRECEHYLAAIGKDIELKFFKAVNGVKEISGVLRNFENNLITLEIDSGKFNANVDDVSSAKILFDWEEFKNE